MVEGHMELTQAQIEAVTRGKAVAVNVAGQECVLVRKDAYETHQPESDATPWTKAEIDLLADETDRIIAESEESRAAS
jgi:hypothetical protein